MSLWTHSTFYKVSQENPPTLCEPHQSTASTLTSNLAKRMPLSLPSHLKAHLGLGPCALFKGDWNSTKDTTGVATPGDAPGGPSLPRVPAHHIH